MSIACERAVPKPAGPPRHARSLHLKWSSARIQQHQIDAARDITNVRSDRKPEQDALMDLFRAHD